MSTETQSRKFLGKIPSGGIKLTPFEKKELRAYTRGNSTFIHGKDINGSPATHEVRFQPRILTSNIQLI